MVKYFNAKMAAEEARRRLGHAHIDFRDLTKVRPLDPETEKRLRDLAGEADAAMRKHGKRG